MENQPTKLDKAVKIIAIVGLLLVSAVIMNYFFIVLPSQKESELESKQDELAFSEKFLCDRKEPYKMPEEIKRALSLRRQRLQDKADKQGEYLSELGSRFIDFENKYQNCYNIQYGDLRLIGGAEGVFWFDNKVSTPNDLKITIDNVYKFNDDLLLAVVLQHEIAHAMEFITKERDGTEFSCTKQEQLAFMVESLFLEILNKGEQDSLIQRLSNLNDGISLNKYSEDFFASLKTIIITKQEAKNKCNTYIKTGKIKADGFQNCKLGVEMESIEKILEKYDYCEEGTGAGNTSTVNPTSADNVNQNENQSANNVSSGDAPNQLEEATRKEQEKQYETQLKLDKKSYDAAIERITLDYNHEVDSLKAKETGEINKTKSMLYAAGQTSQDEQFQQYIKRVEDSYKPQYEYLESFYQSNLKSVKATKYW